MWLLCDSQPSGAGYFEPVTEVDDDGLDGLLLDGGIKMSFQASPIKIEVDLDMIEKLLVEAQNLTAAEHPPAGRDDCDDCGAIRKVLALLADG